MFFSILDNRNQALYLKLVLCFKFKVTGIMKDVQESIFANIQTRIKKLTSVCSSMKIIEIRLVSEATSIYKSIFILTI